MNFSGTWKFEIFKDGQQMYRFRLKAANGQIVAASEAYTSKQNAGSATINYISGGY